MPSLLIAAVVLALVLAVGAAVAAALLWRRQLKAERAEQAAEDRIRQLIAARSGELPQAVNGDRSRRRHLWLVPVVALLASVAAFARAHSVPVAATAAGAAAVGLALMVAVSAPSEQRAEPPELVVPTLTARSPSSQSPLPSDVSPPGSVQPSTRPPGGGTPTTTTEGLLPLPTSVTVPPVETPSLPTSVPPTSVTTSLPQLPEPCLLEVDASPLAEVCVLVHR